MTKETQYRQLICDVRRAYLNRENELKWCEDCREINLWTYWQGRGHLDAQIMLIGQDWGCPWDAGNTSAVLNVQAINHGQDRNYMTGNSNPTDKNLIELFRSIGFDVLRDDPRLFFTNFVLGYRAKGSSGNFKKIWADEDAQFFRRLVDIIRPHVLLCLGKDTLQSVLASFGYSMPKETSYNKLIESTQNPVTVQFADGTKLYVFALAHCGTIGTLNRNRGSNDKFLLNRQKQDWRRILPALWSDPELLHTYWEPSIQLLREIAASDTKRDWCASYSVYAACEDIYDLKRRIDQFIKDTYHNGLIITNYWDVIEQIDPKEEKVCIASGEWVNTLSLESAAACLAYHFRRDHFCEGSLISKSIAEGCILRLMERLYELLMV